MTSREEVQAAAKESLAAEAADRAREAVRHADIRLALARSAYRRALEALRAAQALRDVTRERASDDPLR